jgi:glycosyltransferase involved in cell wall biosynthesis
MIESHDHATWRVHQQSVAPVANQPIYNRVCHQGSRLIEGRSAYEATARGMAQPALWRKPRLAVISPFLDKSHGTERMVIEWIDRLTGAFEVHIYKQNVADINPEKFVVHRIPKVPGPHLFNYLWWFCANHWLRRHHARTRKLEYDLVYSPGTNCLDADAITVHIVFAEFVRRVRSELEFKKNRAALWPLLVHRRLYYRTVMFLERRVFLNPRTQVILTAPQTAEEIQRFFGRAENFPVLPPGIDHVAFNPASRCDSRQAARQSLNITPDRFVLLLVGNDWRKKGLGTLIDALCELKDLPVDLLVTGRDDPAPFVRTIREKSLDGRVRFLRPRKDIEFYYAAADAYVGPSLEDTFALPASEAMACGLPVIISSRAGAAAIVSDGVDGLILEDPTDSKKLAEMILSLFHDAALRERLGQKAAETAQKYTWERSAQDFAAILRRILERKGKAFVFERAAERGS